MVFSAFLGSYLEKLLKKHASGTKVFTILQNCSNLLASRGYRRILIYPWIFQNGLNLHGSPKMLKSTMF